MDDFIIPFTKALAAAEVELTSTAPSTGISSTAHQ